jgi:hypothetical protein
MTEKMIEEKVRLGVLMKFVSLRNPCGKHIL